MNIKDDEELEMLLGEIPYATSSLSSYRMMYGMHDDDDDICSYDQYNVNGSYGYSSYVRPSSSSSFGSMHDPMPKPYMVSRSPYLELPESSFRKEVDENLISGLGRMSLIRFGDFDCLGANPYISKVPPSDVDRNMLSYYYQWGIRAHVGMDVMNERGVGVGSPMHNVSYMNHSKVESNVGPEDLAASEESSIIQGEDLSHVRKKFSSPCESGRTKVKISRFSHLSEARRYIYVMAKDQHTCRLLQKIFDDGNPQHVNIVFNEIIGHVVELMINPFGNYLMQKLLEVCNEEQRMHILMEITREPRELVLISLNTHGTRVVQKLIETIKTRHQVSLVISALQRGFLALIKDLNGNHVIQRCLQCLSYEDNKFIFEAAARFCVEIATHQHGCCVLQRCINHSTGEHREKLVSEISANALLLAQDAFGNYVVQYIIDLQIPSAVSKLTSQFKGNYVHLASQKFSSHVVEKCLAMLDAQVRSTIIQELILATHFEQLLQDPHANYVIQTALRVSEGVHHSLLVNAIESYKAISRNSPYSKRIFSNKLLKR